MMFKKIFLISFLYWLCNSDLLAQKIDPPFLNAASEKWADSVLVTLSRQQKIGQLFMISAFSNKDSVHVAQIDTMIIKYGVGGLIFFQGGPMRQAFLNNRYQAESKVPLLISIDGEWGLSMRLDSTMRFPRQMTLGAMPNKTGIYKMGVEIARQCKLMGIHVNFAPDIDINNNPLNPVINNRSFGENKVDVAQKGLAYMMGLQDNQVLACGKHFPGHGNTESDSHFTLPVISRSADEIDSVELVPFKTLTNAGLGSIMVAHLQIPSLDSTNNRAATLSPNIINGLLKNQLGFKGVVFTDALNMKGVSSYYKPGELELEALKAGNDILLCSDNVILAINVIDSALAMGLLDSTEIYSRVKKILQLKYWCGLNVPQRVDTTDLINKLNNDPSAKWVNYSLYKDAITLIKNNHHAIPIISYKEKSIASLVINDSLNNVFQNELSKYCFLDMHRLSKEPTQTEFDSLMLILNEYKTVILSIHNTSMKSTNNFGISEKMVATIDALKDKTKLILVVFGNSYTLSKFPNLMDADAVVLGYEDTYLPNQLTAEMIFGGFKPEGCIPVSPSENIPLYCGIKVSEEVNILSRSMPQEFGISAKAINQIDSIAKRAIDSGATPGCQIAVAYKGSLIYNKSFGKYTYEDSTYVNNSNLYDIASVTKIAATALAAMYLYDKGKIDLTKKVSKYLPEFKNSNKKDLTLKEIMTHSAGLQAWIPFYKHTIDSAGNLDIVNYLRFQDDLHKTKISDSIFMLDEYKTHIWQQIMDSPLGEKGKYVYSDLGMIIMQHIIESITETTLDSFVFKTFYQPMGIQRITFHPLSRFNKNEIVPTEWDSVFRHQLVQGYVHDPAAAMLGGVSGNAGLFSNAESLTILMQMLLQNGNYGDKQYIKKETVELFTSQQFPGTANRRGLFFDKPEPDKTKNGPTARSSSSATFGHTGFTGTCAWADPKSDLVYVFLSNRVYPSATNNKLTNLNIRTDIMQAIYDSLKLIK